MKPKKKALTIIISIILVICLFPVRLMLKDGGTVIYAAVLYKVIVWKQIMPIEEENETSTGYRTGTDFYIFPFNLGDKEWRE